MWAELFQSKQKIYISGLFGAAGCLLGAIIGQVLFIGALSRTCLLLDCSGSMAGPNLVEMKLAAQRFVDRQNLNAMEIAVIGFGSRINTASYFSRDNSQISNAINILDDGGNTFMSGGINHATQLLGSSGVRNILLFTDGRPNSPSETQIAAMACKSAQINLVVVATGTADKKFLDTLTGNPDLVFYAHQGDLDKAFDKASDAIKTLVGTASGRGSALIHTAVWTALLGLCASLAMIVGQNFYLRKSLPTWQVLAAGAGGGIAAGLVAGIAAEIIFTPLGNTGAVLVGIGRLIGWPIFGGLLGAGLSFFVPNLKLSRGAIGGAVGGGLGAFAFLLAGLIFGEGLARLLGAAVLGFCIGVMIAIFEAAFREAWLEIIYGPKEKRNVTLGRHPVTIGSAHNECTVYAPGAAALALRYTLEGGKVYCEDVPTSRTVAVGRGDSRTAGKITAVVCGDSLTLAAASTAFTKAKQPQQKKADQRKTAPTGKGLRLVVDGRVFPLSEGVRLTTDDLPELEATAANMVAVEVMQNPFDPSILALKNLTRANWIVVMPDSSQHSIEPGKSVRVAPNTTIQFGPVEGKIEHF